MTMIERKAALVTGAGRRIGRALALDLASHGWAVAVHYYTSKADADDVVAECRRRGARATAVQANLARESETADILPQVEERLGPLNLLINNASVFERDEAADATRESWDLHMEVNLRAPFALSQAFVKQLPPESCGLIVNVLDQRVWNLTPHFLSYTLSKSALWTLTRTMAMALAPRVRVNAVGPGPTMRNDRQTEEHFEAQWNAVPLKRPTGTEDVCAAVRYFIDAPSVTGQMLALDGGEHLGWAQPTRGFVAKE